MIMVNTERTIFTCNRYKVRFTGQELQVLTSLWAK